MAIGNGKYKGTQLSLTVDSVEYKMDCKKVVLDREESEDDFTTFADLAAGGSFQWFFDIEAASDFGTGSLWNYVWSNAGDTDVAFVFKPYGNATPSATQPHFTGTLSVGGKPAVGGEAGEVWSFEVRFDVDGTPSMVVS
jgi:hypothetical protein